MSELSASDFDAFFEALHGVPPFPWQRRLLETVLRSGAWPELLDLPTGTGKTAAIDIALFHLALDAGRPETERTAPRKIILVVDRRTVVDQAFERAQKIDERLREATTGVLATVATRLRSLSGTDKALALAQLRGGMPRDDAWARRPDQPLVAVSTVDQVGSRLLFRGYGVSEAMRSVHAGLLGSDTLFLLDEVHLSQPFLKTLQAVRKFRGEAERQLVDRWQVVQMSATAGAATTPFTLGIDDRADAKLAARLEATKPVELREVKVKGDATERRLKFATECAEWALENAAPGKIVGVIVNRVATARDVFALAQQKLGERAFLLTGRMRSLDRDDMNDKLRRLLSSSERSRSPDEPPIVVASTQCIEAGADFDFDLLATECAALDALRQRFGRLNRLGLSADARGVVFVRSDGLKDDADPVYGAALRKTWEWLAERRCSFGVDELDAALRDTDDVVKKTLVTTPGRAPVMLPSHLDFWSQTRPTPFPDPEISFWLHGIEERRAADVQVVWRGDLTTAALERALRDEIAKEAVLARVEVSPPIGLEALSLPIEAVRAWLAREPPVDVADVEGRSAAETRGEEGERILPVVAWLGDETDVVAPNKIKPGMTIVVPAEYGGLVEGNWDPTSCATVTDLGNRARWTQTRRPTIRLSAGALDPTWPEPPSPASTEDGDNDDRERITDWIRNVISSRPADSVSAAIDALAQDSRRFAIVKLDAVQDEREPEPILRGMFAIIGRRRIGAESAGDATTEDDSSSLTGVPVTLRAHLGGVARWARDFAKRCGVADDIARDVTLAASWHDAGKADPRFQRMLRGGSEFQAEIAVEPLAKSALIATDRGARRRARERSGYPRGGRHELSSIRLIELHAEALRGAYDPELVLHLIASHHGWCRPFAPVVHDREPVEVAFDAWGTVVTTSSAHGLEALDSGIADRFWTLTKRYGWFGLAWLEAILRLADHRRSEEEQREPSPEGSSE